MKRSALFTLFLPWICWGQQVSNTPQQLSAFAELQAAYGSQILSMYHKSPLLTCSCRQDEGHVWAAPFGNWLTEKSREGQTGFHADTWGVSLGVDVEALAGWTLGLGASGQKSTIDWNSGAGNGHSQGLYGSFYTDFTGEDFFLSLSSLFGMDWFDPVRRLPSESAAAASSYTGFDGMGQLSAAYFFGAPSCHLFPYADVDLFYLHTHSFQETGGGSWDLSVDPWSQWTLKTGAGLGFEVVDRNYDETICIAPLFAIGWAMQWPFDRENFTYTSAGTTAQAAGWGKTWQLLALRFGLKLYFWNFTLSGNYTGEFDVGGGSPYKNQQCNIRLSLSW